MTTTPLATATRAGLMSPGDKAALAASAKVGFTGVGDASYQMLATDRTVATTAAFSAPRTFTLPAAASVPAGTSLRVLDQAGTVGATNTLTVAASGSDKVNGGASTTFVAPYTDFLVTSDGASRWTYDVQGVLRGGTGATTPAGARTSLGAAASGANADITSLGALTTPLAPAQGGTGATTTAGGLAALGGAAASDMTVAQQNILYQGLLVAALRGVPTGVVDGVIDPYSSLADVNTSKSSNYSFSGGNGTISAGASAVVSTQANAISSSSAANYPASQAFDNNTSTNWYSGESGQNQNLDGVSWVGQDFGAGNTITLQSFSITQPGSGNATNSVVLEYADTPTGTWTTVATIPVTASATTSYTNNGAGGAHRCWRVRIAPGATSTPQGYWGVFELPMSVAQSANMVLQSAALASAVASPSAARVLAQIDPTSAAFTPNTDLLVFFSRDGGTTFTQGSLSLVQTMPDGTTIYDTGYFSVSGQPAGNSTMTYKLTTPTSKAVVLTGASMQVKP